jgi:hypothetical protein
MVLREKPKSIRMTKAENVVTYLTKMTQVRDELGVVGEAIVDNELVRTTLNGVTKPRLLGARSGSGSIDFQKFPVAGVFFM